MRTILNENVETLLDQQGGIEDDEAIAEWQNVVTRAGFEEFADGSLRTRVR